MKKIVRRITLSAALLCSPLYASVQFFFGHSESELKTPFTPTLSLENVYREIIRQEIQHPEIVMKQVIAETRWLKCTHCSLQFNNIFGFYTKSGYLKFDHWTDAVIYYKNWQDTYYKGGDYYTFLRRIGYATAPNYIALLKGIRLPEFT